MLPIEKEKQSKVTYFLCILSDACKLNALKSVDKFTSDESDSNLKWLNYNQIRFYQRNYKLMGLEVLNFCKDISESKIILANPNIFMLGLLVNYFLYLVTSESVLRTNIELLYNEPQLVYYDTSLSGINQSAAELLIQSAKFSKIS